MNQGVHSCIYCRRWLTLESRAYHACLGLVLESLRLIEELLHAW